MFDCKLFNGTIFSVKNYAPYAQNLIQLKY